MSVSDYGKHGKTYSWQYDSILSTSRNLFVLGLHSQVLVAGGPQKSDGIRKVGDRIRETALLPEEKVKVMAIAWPPSHHTGSLATALYCRIST